MSHGHRVFGVEDIQVQKIIARAIRNTGLNPLRQFVSGATNQIVFVDGTVVNVLDRNVIKGVPSSAVSLPVDDPERAAKDLVVELHEAGFVDAVYRNPVPNVPFVMVFSESALPWFNVGFRSLEVDGIEESIGELVDLD